MASEKTVGQTPMSHWAPSPKGARHPESAVKKNGITWNWPRFQFFGGMQQPYSQAGSKPIVTEASSGQNAAGPISDRGQGRG